MKKEVQALIKRRRARYVPLFFLGIALLLVVGLLAFLVVAVSGAAGGFALALIRTATPTATLTPTASATATQVPATNTPTETATITVTPGPSPTATQFVYVVKEGDTLFSIAEEFGANVCLIMAVNNLTDASFLTVGQSLIIPPHDVELPTATPLPTGLPRGARVEYVVQCGDTLDSIAAKFNSTGADIAETNAIDDPLSIRIGDVLIVRVNIATPTPTSTFTNTAPAPDVTETPAPAGTAAATATP